MPGIVRKGDNSTPDPCKAPPRPPSSYSSNVFANSKNVVRVGDGYVLHACPGSPPHGASATGGSSTVFVNGRGVHRNGDSISCGSKGNNGSTTVFAN